MARSNKSNSEYPSYIGRRRHATQPEEIGLLGRVGLSVFRSFESSQFDPVFHTLEEVLGGAVIRTRGQGMEKPPGVSLLEMGEVKRQKPLGQIAITGAINELWRSIGSLRHRVTATPSQIELLGRAGHETRVLVVMFDESTANQLTNERMQILKVLEGLAETPSEYSWSEQKQPHISLARMSGSQVEKATARVREKIRQSLPPTVTLHRATLYNPSRGN